MTRSHGVARWLLALAVVALPLAAQTPPAAQAPPADAAAMPPASPAPATDTTVAPATPLPGDNLTVSVYTFGPGEEVWERFGHNAIEIRDEASGRAILYNYGIFDFSQENFFVNFARGLMTYRIAADLTDEALPQYLDEGRWVVRQRLALLPAQRQALADFLAWNVREENAQYRYDYFRANCSTRVRDAIDKALDGAIKAQTIAPSRGYTYRIDADRLMRPDPAIMLAIDAGLGPFADQRLSYWDESFVPTEFMRHLREIRIADASGAMVPIVAEETQVAKARLADPPEGPIRWTWQALGVGVVLGLALLAASRGRRSAVLRTLYGLTGVVVSLVLGVGGLVLGALWLLTDHQSAWRNENLLLFDPLCLLLLPAFATSLRARWQPTRFARRVALAAATLALAAWFVKVLPGFVQDNALWVAVLLPWHAAVLASFALVPAAPSALERWRPR